MIRSIHDNNVLSYAVDAVKGEIVLRTAFPNREGPDFTNVLFRGVTAYFFEGDNLRTILLNIGEVPAEQVFEQEKERFTENRKVLWPGGWNDSDASVMAHIAKTGVRAYVIQSAYGMAGWVWATSMDILAAEDSGTPPRRVSNHSQQEGRTG
jgi:hypothetical protein